MIAAPLEDLAGSKDISRALRNFPLDSQFDTGHSRLVTTSKGCTILAGQEPYCANVCVREVLTCETLEGRDIADCICVSSQTPSVSSKLQITQAPMHLRRGCMCLKRQELADSTPRETSRYRPQLFAQAESYK